MNRTMLMAALGVLGFAMTGCGGPEVDVAKTTQGLNGNCTELCRRYVSMDRAPLGPVVGRFFPDPASTGVATAESYLIQAGGLPASQRGARCSMGNVAVRAQWNVIQPRFDIYRDLAGQSSSLIAQCASDFGL